MSLNPNEFERAIQQVETRRKIAQAEARAIRKAVDSDGKVKVYRPGCPEPIRLWPVDAAEQIKRGLASLEPPMPPEAVPPSQTDSEPVPSQEPSPQPQETPVDQPLDSGSGKRKGARSS